MIIKRHTIKDKFTDLLCDRNQWYTEPRLKANIQRLILSFPDQDEDFWFNYFLQQTREQNCTLSKNHLMAYLEETSYRCARRAKFRFSSTPLANTFDYFLQEARIIVYGAKFWQTYNPKLSKPLIYAYKKLEPSLKESLFTNRHSEYGLLLRTSRKRLTEALQIDGFKEPQLSIHLQVRDVVKGIGTNLPRIGKVIDEPTPDQLIKICQYLQESGINILYPRQIKEILQHCIKALKPKPERGGSDVGELMDREYSKSYDDELLASLEIIQPPEYSEIFSSILSKLIIDSVTDKLLILRYGFVGINQELIGTEFDMRQHSISRKLNRIKDEITDKLRQELINWSLENSQIQISIDLADKLVNNLLIWYYRQQVIYPELENALRSQPNFSDGISILSIYFSILPQSYALKLLDYKLTKAKLKQQIKISQARLAKDLSKTACKLRINEQKLIISVNSLTKEAIVYLSEWLIHKYSLSTGLLNEIEDYLDQTIYVFLANVCYAPMMTSNKRLQAERLFSNVLSKKIFSKIWQPWDELVANLNMNLTMVRQTRLQQSCGRKIDLKLAIANQSLALVINFQEEDNKYFIQVRLYPTNGQTYLPEQVGLLMLETNGNVFKQAKSREVDNWIQVEFMGRIKEEFQIKIQLEEVSIIENFVV